VAGSNSILPATKWLKLQTLFAVTPRASGQASFYQDSPLREDERPLTHDKNEAGLGQAVLFPRCINLGP